jgi:hypothetical protein
MNGGLSGSGTQQVPWILAMGGRRGAREEGWALVVHAESGNREKKEIQLSTGSKNSRLHSIALFCVYDRGTDCVRTVTWQ